MAIQIDRDGYFEITYSGPFTGLHVQAPEILIPDTATPFTSGFMFRNAELRSAPVFQLEFPGTDQTNLGLGQTTFNDVNGIAHTVAFTTRGLWQLAPAGTPPGSSQPWAILGGPALLVGIPVSYRTFANLLYYTNGGTFLASWDGLTNTPTAANAGAPGSTSIAAVPVADAPTVIPGSTGPLSIGGVYLAELDNHLLLASVSVLDNGTGVVFPFPNRIWWSANGLPLVWDFAANTNAGENDFLDVPDSITGFFTIGIQGFVFRSSGITQITPTGRGIAPFQFDHLWASDRGIGNVYPWSIAQYGAIGCFVSAEQIYQMGVASFEAIGGTARDAIMTDLSRASGVPVGQLIPFLIFGYTYLLYMISIPLQTFTRHYWYSVEDKNWAVVDTQGLLITGRPEQCWTGILTSLGVPGLFPPSVSAGSGAPATGGGSGGGGGGTGGGGGFGCFTGNVRVFTPLGLVRFDELPWGVQFEIINRNGIRKAELVVHENYSATMLDMGNGELVTEEHGISKGDDWIAAVKVWPDLPRVMNWQGTVYNLHVLTEDEEDRHFILENGAVAHNNRPLKS